MGSQMGSKMASQIPYVLQVIHGTPYFDHPRTPIWTPDPPNLAPLITHFGPRFGDDGGGSEVVSKMPHLGTLFGSPGTSFGTPFWLFWRFIFGSLISPRRPFMSSKWATVEDQMGRSATPLKKYPSRSVKFWVNPALGLGHTTWQEELGESLQLLFRQVVRIVWGLLGNPAGFLHLDPKLHNPPNQACLAPIVLRGRSCR